MEMLSYSRKPFAGLSLNEEHNPARLFEHAILDFTALQEDLVAHHHDFIEPLGEIAQVDARVCYHS